jgi:prepilin-type N-terminal cleavage/methylation domain-containing protein
MAFTLIELLVVIAIISLLSSVVMASLNAARLKARDAKRVQDMHQLETALRLYYDATGNYPTNTYDGSTWTAGFKSALAPYISTVPVDPSNNGSPYYYFYIYNMSQSWLSANGWIDLSSDCVGKTLLGVHRMEEYGSWRKDCTTNNSAMMVISL